jgi:NAD(P)-dependent dehydrogenase (short-subunit alcohol dehydrogenase family)
LSVLTLYSGAAAIGLETTILLARKGCTVYVASRNRTKATLAIDDAVARLCPDAKDRIVFHHLDLSSIPSALDSANAFLSHKNARLDILIGNAAIMTATYTLSPDGIESTFATNVLGHYAFITTLLPLLRKAENARVVVVNSLAHAKVSAIDYEELTRENGEDGTSFMDMRKGFARYGVSKLGLMYLTRELDRRLRNESIKTVRVNTCHPGTASSSSLE